MVPSEKVLQLVWDTITASSHKMLEDTATSNTNITSEVAGNVALLSDFDLVSFDADGSTVDIDAFASSERSSSSSLSKGGRPKWSTSVVRKTSGFVDTKNLCYVAFRNLKQSKENNPPLPLFRLVPLPPLPNENPSLPLFRLVPPI
jgi:hypothetical protein